jgi:hypothetical protein
VSLLCGFIFLHFYNTHKEHIDKAGITCTRTIRLTIIAAIIIILFSRDRLISLEELKMLRMLVKGWIWRNVPGVLDFLSDFDFFFSNIYFSYQPESQLLYASPAETACKFVSNLVK